MRERLRGWLAAGAAILLAGCASVPTSGPVRTHTPGPDQVTSNVQVAPVPPAAGATQMLIVEGFLHAMGTDEDGFAVARQYLSTAAAAVWDPESGTQVYADTYLPSETEDSIVLVAPLVGRLDTGGSYLEASGQLHHDFGLVKAESGEWRISRPPSGLLVSRYSFSTNFLGVSLSFAARAGSVLVPDARHFSRATGLLERVVRAQLSGPGEWTSALAREAFEPAPRLVSAGLVGGTVTVALDQAALALSLTDREVLLAELVTTIVQLPGVNQVRVEATGTAIALPSTGLTSLTQRDIADWTPADVAASKILFAVRDGSVVRLDPELSVGPAAPVAPGIARAGAIAVSRDLSSIAALDSAGTTLSVGSLTSEVATTLVENQPMIRPDYARNGDLWVFTSGDTPTASVFAADGGRTEVTLDLPPGPVRAFRISPDGTRIAVVVGRNDADQTGIAQIHRSKQGIRLAAFLPVTIATPAEGRRVLDIAWTTPTELLALLSHPDGPVSVVQAAQDSSVSSDIGPGEVLGLSELAVVPGRQAVARGDGLLYRYEGDFTWKLTLSAVDAMTYSG